MQHCFLKVKKLSEGAKMPSYGSKYAAAADLFCLTDDDEILIAPETTVFIHTGIAMEIPEGMVGLIRSKRAFPHRPRRRRLRLHGQVTPLRGNGNFRAFPGLMDNGGADAPPLFPRRFMRADNLHALSLTY